MGDRLTVTVGHTSSACKIVTIAAINVFRRYSVLVWQHMQGVVAGGVTKPPRLTQPVLYAEREMSSGKCLDSRLGVDERQLRQGR